MPADLSKYPELLIVSDTAVYVDDQGKYLAFEPVVREIEHFSHLFKSITWIAFHYPLNDSVRNIREVSKVDISYVLLPAVGGSSIHNKLKIIRAYFRLILLIPGFVRKADVIHTRGPSHPALITIFYSIFFYRNKIFWHKYAGNWIRTDDPLSYKMNKYLLKKASRTKVTINGQWPDQPEHILSFENPCLTEQERIEGERILQSKNYEGQLDFIFVGQLTESKGVGRIIGAFQQLKDEPRVGTLNLVGDGPERARYEKLAVGAKINCRFYGFLSKEKVNKVLASSHTLLLPSESEGFPKVIAEGTNYGCIPVASAVSSIPQYINDNINGFIMPSIDKNTLKHCIDKLISLHGSDLKQMALKGHEMGHKFTYDYYNRRIAAEILGLDNQDRHA